MSNLQEFQSMQEWDFSLILYLNPTEVVVVVVAVVCVGFLQGGAERETGRLLQVNYDKTSNFPLFVIHVLVCPYFMPKSQWSSCRASFWDCDFDICHEPENVGVRALQTFLFNISLKKLLRISSISVLSKGLSPRWEVTHPHKSFRATIILTPVPWISLESPKDKYDSKAF